MLAQFPTSFHCVRENVRYLRRFRELMEDLPVVVEFRHRGWIRDETFGFLREHEFGFCCVDQPQFEASCRPSCRRPRPSATCASTGATTRSGGSTRRPGSATTTSTREEELGEWVGKVRGLAAETEETYLFFNNHYHAQAVQNATDFADLLEAADVR